MSPKVKKLIVKGFGPWINLDANVPCSREEAQRVVGIVRLINQTECYSEFVLKITIEGKIGKRWMPSAKVYEEAKRNYKQNFVRFPSIYELEGKEQPWP